MRNPWQDIDVRKDSLLIHPSDLAHVDAFNNLHLKNKHYTIPYHLPPLPYVGRPEAPVLILLANPGLSDKEAKLNFKYPPKVLEENHRNLLHLPPGNFDGEDSTAPFSRFQDGWWHKRVRKLVDSTSIRRIESGLFFVNFHPYHSRSWKSILFTLPTQHYSFELVRRALKRNCIVLMSRNTEGWITAIPELSDYKNKYNFLSPRGVYISPKNLPPGVFKKVVSSI